MFDAGNFRPPTTPLMQPVSPPLCKMTGASTCTPFTAPVRWMRNLTVMRPGMKVYSSGRARVTQAEHGVLLGAEARVDLVLRQLAPDGVVREVEAHVLGLRQILALPARS